MHWKIQYPDGDVSFKTVPSAADVGGSQLSCMISNSGVRGAASSCLDPYRFAVAFSFGPRSELDYGVRGRLRPIAGAPPASLDVKNVSQAQYFCVVLGRCP